MNNEEILERAAEWGKRLRTWGMKEGKKAGKTAGSYGREARRVGHTMATTGLGKSIANNPMSYLLPAGVALGVYKAHPIKATHPFAYAQDMAFGDPHVFRTLAYSYANDALMNAFSSSAVNNARQNIFSAYTMGNSGNSYYGSYADPSYGYVASQAMGGINSMGPGSVTVGGGYSDNFTYSEAMMRQERQDNPSYGLSGPDVQGPDGSIVFGMYNRRLNA